MRRFLFDTGIAQHFINGRYRIREQAEAASRAGARIGICVPVLGELWAGVEGSASRQRNHAKLRHALSRLVIWPFTNEAAERFGIIFAELRRIGRPMQQIDIQIAAIAFTLGDCTVVSSDSDLRAVPGLPVENWVE
jgi:tRNA(fMet)-specific endonuclease VapC